MKLLDNLDRYLTDYEYKIIIKNKYINIINYTEILDFNSKEIKIKSKIHSGQKHKDRANCVDGDRAFD